MTIRRKAVLKQSEKARAHASARTAKLIGVDVRELRHTVPEAAEILGISPKTLWTWIGERKIAVYRIGRSVRVGEHSIAQILEQGFTPARDAA